MNYAIIIAINKIIIIIKARWIYCENTHSKTIALHNNKVHRKMFQCLSNQPLMQVWGGAASLSYQ